MPHSSFQLCERGVYQLPFLSMAGTFIAAAIGSDHRVISWVSFTEDTRDTTIKTLETLLDSQDPPQMLKVV